MAKPTPRMTFVAGTDFDRTWQTPNADGTKGGVFAAGDVIGSRLWVGDGEITLATPTVVWGSDTVAAADGAAQTLWTIQFQATDTAAIAPGRYRLQVFAVHSGRTAVLWDGLLDLTDAPGSATTADLITLTYAESAIVRTRLAPQERDFLPSLVTVASDTIRKWCGQRDFTRQTYTEEHVAELNGYIALRQYPVNNVTRIRGYQDTVLTLSADSSVYQQAWINYTTSGDWYTGTLAYTGVALNWWASGTAGTRSFLFASYPTVASLASAIAGVSGWRALTAGPYSLYPTADFSPPGGLTSQGALDDDACEIQAYTQDLTAARVANKSGMLWVGRRRISTSFGPRWGEDWETIEDLGGTPVGRVQVAYDAGFTTIPTPVQLATAELTKALVERLRANHMLTSESIGGAGSRAYQIADGLVGMLPRPVLQGLSLWRRIGVR